MRNGCDLACAGLLPDSTLASRKAAAARRGGQGIENEEKRYLISELIKTVSLGL
jgi:hypothetical protein